MFPSLASLTIEIETHAVRPRRISVLGATGSIGESTLDLIGRDPSAYQVVALTGGQNAARLAELAILHRAELAVIADPDGYAALRAALAGTGIEIGAGEEALLEAAARPADWVMAAIVGLSTLRLSGVHFVIFTFGLAELVRQLVVWFEVNKSRVLGRYVFVDITQRDIYWQLLALAIAVFVIGFFIARSRLGFALRIIGEDETVAQHCGIDTTVAKVALFTISATAMALVGANMGRRWS